MYWDVVEARVEDNLKLSVTFSDGTNGHVTFKPQYLSGVFEPLQNPDFFQQVYIDNGVVTWPGEIDLAPDAMYQQIKQYGEWILM